MLIIKIHGSSVDTFTIGQGQGGDKFLSSGTEDIQWDDAANLWRLSRLQMGAGSTTEAPFKLTSGSLTTAPDDGAMEYDGSHLYFTVGASRFQIDQQGSAPNSFVQNGNAFGALATLGTTDNYDLRFIVNNVERTRLLPAGNFIIGGTTVSAGEILRVNQLAQDPSGNTYGVYFDTNFAATSVDFNQHTGFTLVTQSSGTSNHTAVSGFVSRTSNSSSAKTTTLNGISSIVGNSSTGRTTTLTCINATVDSPGTGLVDTLVALDVAAIDIATASSVYGLRVADLNQSGADAKYGVYLGEISNAITTSYAIYSLGGQSYHAGNFGFGVTIPTARIHAAAGTATAGTAPIKMTSGTALGTAEDGAFEYHSSHLYFTIGSTRFQLDQQAPSGTAFVQNGNAFGALATLGTTDAQDLRFITNNAEIVRISSTGGYVGIGTTDFDGTPAVGKLVVKGSTNDGSTNILALRDSDETNVLTVDTDGRVQALYASGYSLFGDATSVGTYNTSDCLAAIRVVSAANSARALVGSAESSSTSGTTTMTLQGINGFCRVHPAASASFTTVNSGGGLRNRYQIIHSGTGTVAKGSAISVGFTLGDSGTGNVSTITTGAGLNVENPNFATASTIGTFYGLLVQGGALAASGIITTRYGIYVESLVGGTTRYGVYQAGASDTNYFAGNTTLGTAVAPDQLLTFNGTSAYAISFKVSGTTVAHVGMSTGSNEWITGSTANDLCIRTNGAKQLWSNDNGTTAHLYLAANGNFGIRTTPTARLHLPAGTSAASTAPLKFTSGTNLTAAEAGAMEFDGTNLYFTPGATRYTILLNPMTAQYDLIIGGASGVAARLAKGANNTVLGVNGSGVVTYLSSLPATLLDINGATEFTGTPNGADDSLIFYNSAAGGNRKILLNTLAKKKRTIALSAQGAILPVTSPATEVTAELATNKRSYRALEFSASATNGAEWLITMPPEYDGGTVTILVQWLSTTAGAATNNGVRWSVAAIATNDSDAFDAAWGTAVAFTDTYDAAHVANDLRISSESSAITIAGTPAGGSLVSIRLQRLGADALDTFAGTARLLKMIMKYGENKWSA